MSFQLTRRMRIATCFVLLLVATPTLAHDPVASVARIKKDLYYLAGDECNGRGVGTPGNDKAADYIAQNFRDAGLAPATKDGSYFQPFKIGGRTKLGAPIKLTLTTGTTPKELAYPDDFSPTGLTTTGKLTGELAFVGYGLFIPKLKYDDFAGIDLKGKTAIILRKTPLVGSKDNPFEAEEFANSPALLTKADEAIKRGATAIVFVSDRSVGTDDPLMDFRRNLFDNNVAVPVVHIKRTLLAVILKSNDVDLAAWEKSVDEARAPKSMLLPKAKLVGEITVIRPSIECKNVVGVLPGSGPLAEETVVVGAHYDHLGTDLEGSLGGLAARGQVHFGADDNASGTTGIIELARRMASMKNRIGRRIVFIAFSAEEKGLYGSKHYANNPLFPLENTVFMLNMDMIGRSSAVDAEGVKKDRLVVNGTGTGEGFDALIEDANKPYNFKLYKVATGTGPSDHDSFYRKKVPVLFLYTGTHRDYHRPSDTPDKINYDAMNKVIDMVEGLTVHFASTITKPKFLTVRGGWADPTDDNPHAGATIRAPKLGVMPDYPYDEENKGMRVENTSPGGAAEKGGMLAGDILIEINGKPIKNTREYMSAMGGQKPGIELPVTVLRDGKKTILKLVPKE